MIGLRLDAYASGRTLLVVLGQRSDTRPTAHVVSPADALALCGRPTGRRGQPELSSSEGRQGMAYAAEPTGGSVGITRTIPCELVRAPPLLLLLLLLRRRLLRLLLLPLLRAPLRREGPPAAARLRRLFDGSVQSPEESCPTAAAGRGVGQAGGPLSRPARPLPCHIPGGPLPGSRGGGRRLRCGHRQPPYAEESRQSARAGEGAGGRTRG